MLLVLQNQRPIKLEFHQVPFDLLFQYKLEINKTGTLPHGVDILEIWKSLKHF